MNLGLPVSNTTVSVLRGTSVNQWGDKIDSNTPVYTGISAGLYETNKTVFDPANQVPRTIREIVLYLPQDLGVTNDDRIIDEATGDTYMISSVTRPPTLIPMHVPFVYGLKRVTANQA